MSITTNLIAYWKLDESSGNAADSVGSRTLTNQNTVVYAAALINNGADFGTTNTNKALLKTDNAGVVGGAFAISMWVKLRTEIAAGQYTFFNQIDVSGGSYVGNAVYYEYNGGTRRLQFDRTRYNVANDRFAYNITLGTSNWIHLVYSYDGATVTGYVNNVSVGTVASTGNGVSGGAITLDLIGMATAYDHAGGQGLNYSDEVGIWSRALTVAEVNQLYNSGFGTSYPLFANSRYWVGGTGNWDAATTTHWTTISGGAGGASVPTLTSDVIFDGSSGGGTTTITAAANCLNLTTTGYAGIIAGSSALSVYGNTTLGSGMTMSYTGTLTLSATGTGNTITTNAVTLNGPLVFNGSGGAWTFQDNFTSSSTVTLTAGTINLSSVTITFTGSGTVWTGGATLNAGTSTIQIINFNLSSKTFSGGGLTYNKLLLTGSGTGTFIIVGNNTFNDFKVDTPPHTVNFTAGSSQTVTTFTVNGTAGNLITLQSTTSGTQWVLKSTNTITCDYLSLQDSNAVHI